MRQESLTDLLGEVMADMLELVKPDGSAFKNIRARVTSRGVLITDIALPIATGDVLIRRLPSGIEERLIVDDPGFSPAVRGVPALFVVRCHKVPPWGLS